jgi:hypothetical protein
MRIALRISSVQAPLPGDALHLVPGNGASFTVRSRRITCRCHRQGILSVATNGRGMCGESIGNCAGEPHQCTIPCGPNGLSERGGALAANGATPAERPIRSRSPGCPPAGRQGWGGRRRDRLPENGADRTEGSGGDTPAASFLTGPIDGTGTLTRQDYPPVAVAANPGPPALPSPTPVPRQGLFPRSEQSTRPGPPPFATCNGRLSTDIGATHLKVPRCPSTIAPPI